MSSAGVNGGQGDGWGVLELKGFTACSYSR
jgi:hypothetical protein